MYVHTNRAPILVRNRLSMQTIRGHRVLAGNGHAFLSMINTALEFNYGISIAPDDINMLICQALAPHIALKCPPIPRMSVLETAGDIINDMTVLEATLGKSAPDFARLVCWFSTTTNSSMISQYLTYFNRRQAFHTLRFGSKSIPFVRIEGERDDWKMMADQLAIDMTKYGAPVCEYMARTREIVQHFVDVFDGAHDQMYLFAISPYTWIYDLMGIKNHHRESNVTHSQWLEYQFEVANETGVPSLSTLECGVIGVALHDEDPAALESHYLSLKYDVHVVPSAVTWEWVPGPGCRAPCIFDHIEWSQWNYSQYRYGDKKIHEMLPDTYLSSPGLALYSLRGRLSLFALADYYHVTFAGGALEFHKYIPDLDDLQNCRYALLWHN